MTFGVLLAAISVAGCGDSGRAKPFAVVHIDNSDASDIIINGCSICGGPVRALGRSSGVGVDTDWNISEPSSLTYTVQIVGAGQVTCRPRQPVSADLDETKTYDLRYRVTADGRCVVTRQRIKS
jgi:hypothetical protein